MPVGESALQPAKRTNKRPRRPRRVATPPPAEKDDLPLEEVEPLGPALLKDGLEKVDLLVADRDVTITGMHYVTTCTSTTCVTNVHSYRISSATTKKREVLTAEVVPTAAQQQVSPRPFPECNPTPLRPVPPRAPDSPVWPDFGSVEAAVRSWPAWAGAPSRPSSCGFTGHS